MYSEETLRALANWEPVGTSNEAGALAAAKLFSQHINPDFGTRAFVRQATYENFTYVYVYLPANASRSTDASGIVRTAHESLVLCFSHLVPIAALGTGSWGETKDSEGKVMAWGYSGLDAANLLSEEQVRDGPLKTQLHRAIRSTGYTIATPEVLGAPAPSWFEPLQRSEGREPWNRMFHLLFQYCD